MLIFPFFRRENSKKPWLELIKKIEKERDLKLGMIEVKDLLEQGLVTDAKLLLDFLIEN